MPRLLLIDDDPDLIRTQAAHALTHLDVQIDVARTGADGLSRLAAEPPDVILLDVRLPDLSGLEVYQRVRAIDARIPVVFITATTAADTAIEAMQQGAYDYLLKPLDPQQLRRVVSQALQLTRLMREPAVVAQTLPGDDQGDAIIGCCPAMLEVYKAIGRVAHQNVTVLITGESGTGKELAARAIYQHGARVRAPFHAINCAAIPESLLESELFGHEKGAFTGAERRRIGKFEQCTGGTLFLDEIGDMPLGMQVKILRVMQNQRFERVGGDETIQTDVRLIAATHRDLKIWSADGKFRPDLYYRLSVFTIALPPLRERGDDLVMLIHQYLRRFNRELGREIREIAPEALERLNRHSWPGNIRELQSVLKQAACSRPPGRYSSQRSCLTASMKESARPHRPRARRRGSCSSRSCGGAWMPARTTCTPKRTANSTASCCRWRWSSPAATSVLAARMLGIARQTLGVKLREAGPQGVKRSVEGEVDKEYAATDARLTVQREQIRNNSCLRHPEKLTMT